LLFAGGHGREVQSFHDSGARLNTERKQTNSNAEMRAPTRENARVFMFVHFLFKVENVTQDYKFTDEGALLPVWL
jgi:hypothetical protein